MLNLFRITVRRKLATSVNYERQVQTYDRRVSVNQVYVVDENLNFGNRKCIVD